MQVFGAKVFVKDKNPGKGKFESRATPGIFVRYGSQSKADQVHLPESRKSIVSRDVKFMLEPAFLHKYPEILDEPNGGRVRTNVDIKKPRVPEENQRNSDYAFLLAGSPINWEARK